MDIIELKKLLENAGEIELKDVDVEAEELELVLLP